MPANIQPPRPAPVARPGFFASWKQRAWYELHAHAAAVVAVGRLDAVAEQGWLRGFASRIPCPGCRSHWRRLVATHPPELAHPLVYFCWTVRAHNAVNAALSKRRMPFAEACRLYGVTLTPVPL